VQRSFDGRKPSSGPTTRSMAMKIQEDWNFATVEKLSYTCSKCHKPSVE